MKKYFIQEIDDENWTCGLLTNNLQKDFIDRHGVKWHEEFEEGDTLGLEPTISDVEVTHSNSEVWIYELNENEKRQELIAHFNFMRENYEEELQEFIYDNYRKIEMENESTKSILRFKDYNK